MWSCPHGCHNKTSWDILTQFSSSHTQGNLALRKHFATRSLWCVYWITDDFKSTQIDTSHYTFDCCFRYLFQSSVTSRPTPSTQKGLAWESASHTGSLQRRSFWSLWMKSYPILLTPKQFRWGFANDHFHCLWTHSNKLSRLHSQLYNSWLLPWHIGNILIYW